VTRDKKDRSAEVPFAFHEQHLPCKKVAMPRILYRLENYLASKFTMTILENLTYLAFWGSYPTNYTWGYNPETIHFWKVLLIVKLCNFFTVQDRRIAYYVRGKYCP